MKIQTMRAEISTVYPNDIWAKKVQRMSDNQVIAIWYNFQKVGKCDQPTIVTPKNLEKEENSIESVQLSIFDIGERYLL